MEKLMIAWLAVCAAMSIGTFAFGIWVVIKVLQYAGII